MRLLGFLVCVDRVSTTGDKEDVSASATPGGPACTPHRNEVCPSDKGVLRMVMGERSSLNSAYKIASTGKYPGFAMTA